jgi:hypothetical protein
MTEKEIVRMAREAGWRVDFEGEILEGDGWHIQTDIVERFAELVAAAEREKCADELFADGWGYAAKTIRARGQE